MTNGRGAPGANRAATRRERRDSTTASKIEITAEKVVSLRAAASSTTRWLVRCELARKALDSARQAAIAHRMGGQLSAKARATHERAGASVAMRVTVTLEPPSGLVVARPKTGSTQ